MDESTYRVELRGGGWPEAIGYVRDPTTATLEFECLENGLKYKRVALDALVFHHAPAVLVMQGMALQDLFPPDSRLVNEKKRVLVEGPFVLLKGELTKPWDPPLRLKNVVLAALEHVPEGLRKEEVLALLLAKEF